MRRGSPPGILAQQEPSGTFIGAEGSLFWLIRREASPYFYGEVSERRPWAFPRDDRPKGVPNSSMLDQSAIRRSPPLNCETQRKTS